MSTPADVTMLSVERLNTGVVIQFDDGICVFYSARLLKNMAEEGELLDEQASLW